MTRRRIATERVALGVDIGGTTMTAGIVDGAGRVVDSTRFPTPAHDLDAIVDAVAEAYREFTHDHDIEAVGVAAAAYVDASTGRAVLGSNIAWDDYPLYDNLRHALGRRAGRTVPVVLENDANAAAWGEFRWGAGAGTTDFLLLTVGTGLGAGIIADGRLVRGRSGFAGEVGHIRIVPGGRQCGCGAAGCWEQYASGTALMRRARRALEDGTPAPLLRRLVDQNGGRLVGRLITAAATAGDDLSVALLGELAVWLAVGAATLREVLDPEVIAVGGGVGQAGPLLMEPFEAALVSARTRRPADSMRMATGQLGPAAGVIGAASLARSSARDRAGPNGLVARRRKAARGP